MKKTRLTMTAIAAVLLCGCQSDHLLFSTYTKVGIDIASVGGTPTRATFGYKRFEGAIIPVDPNTAKGQAEDVKSVYAAMALTNGWLTGLSIVQVFATGEAAVKSANENLAAKALGATAK